MIIMICLVVVFIGITVIANLTRAISIQNLMFVQVMLIILIVANILCMVYSGSYDEAQYRKLEAERTEIVDIINKQGTDDEAIEERIDKLNKKVIKYRNNSKALVTKYYFSKKVNWDLFELIVYTK